ncbi:hypothetical protein AX16_004868 [Volvariella volvacea WC 439]|nr:hypothetical protein AX16_004868 [Volvariella volvacea WC 439]
MVTRHAGAPPSAPQTGPATLLNPIDEKTDNPFAQRPSRHIGARHARIFGTTTQGTIATESHLRLTPPGDDLGWVCSAGRIRDGRWHIRFISAVTPEVALL